MHRRCVLQWLVILQWDCESTYEVTILVPVAIDSWHTGWGAFLVVVEGECVGSRLVRGIGQMAQQLGLVDLQVRAMRLR